MKNRFNQTSNEKFFFIGFVSNFIISCYSDVIPPPCQPSQSISALNETSQVTHTDKSEGLPSPVVNAAPVPVTLEIDQSKSAMPVESKYCPTSRASSRYANRCSHPVPKPLTLQGEKTVDPDFMQSVTRSAAYPMTYPRRGSLKGQPLIMHMFEDSIMETQRSMAKPEPAPPTKPCGTKMKKARPNFIKCPKPKKPVLFNKSKPSTPAASKVVMKCQSTSTDVSPDENPGPNVLIVGGTDWMMTVKAQPINNEEPTISEYYDASPVDDEDLPYCGSPTDHLEISQSTLMTSVGELQRRDSIGSEQAIEISPVLAQIIEHHMELTTESTLHPPKPTNEPPLYNSDIRTVYETVKDSIRKDTSLRSIPLQSNEHDASLVRPSLTPSISSQSKTLPFELASSVSQTYNNSDTGFANRPALRVVTDSLNSRGKICTIHFDFYNLHISFNFLGSETIDSTSSQEDFSNTPICTENDCDEIYRTARKGRQVGRGVSLTLKLPSKENLFRFNRHMELFGHV